MFSDNPLPRPSLPIDESISNNDPHMFMPSSDLRRRDSSRRYRTGLRIVEIDDSTRRESDRVVVGEIEKKLNRRKRLKNSFKSKYFNCMRTLEEYEYLFNWWSGSRRALSSQFGNGVVSYFYFNGLLVQLNMLMSLIMICFTLVVHFATPPHDHLAKLPPNSSRMMEIMTQSEMNTVLESRKCSEILKMKQFNESNTTGRNLFDDILDAITGKGVMNDIPVFLGFYFNKTIYDTDKGKEQHYFNSPVAWLIAYLACVALCFVKNLISTGKSYKKCTMESGNQMHPFSVKVLTCWDYSLTNTKQAKLKQKFSQIDLETELTIQNEKLLVTERSRNQWIVIYLIRTLVNILFVFLVFGVYALISYVLGVSSDAKKKEKNRFLSMFFSFLPSITIALVNVIVPILGNVIRFEKYLASTELMIRLWRTVFIRLISLFFHMLSLLKLIERDSHKSVESCTECWENHLAREYFLLAEMDLAIHLVSPILVVLTRSLFVRYLGKRFKRLTDLIGRAEFDLPLLALELINSQTVVWLGFFFCPFLPALFVINLFCTFYIRKWLLIYNHTVVNARTHQAARSERFFLDVLMITLILTVVPIGFLITKQPVSRGCSPFRMLHDNDSPYFSTSINLLLENLSPKLLDIVEFVTSKAMLIALIILFLVLISLCYVQIAAKNQVLEILGKQTTAGLRDRTFLLERVQAALFAANIANESPAVINRKSAMT